MTSVKARKVGRVGVVGAWRAEVGKKGGGKLKKTNERVKDFFRED